MCWFKINSICYFRIKPHKFLAKLDFKMWCVQFYKYALQIIFESAPVRAQRTELEKMILPCSSWTTAYFVTSFILWISGREKTHDIFFFAITIVWLWTFFYFVKFALWMLCFIIVFLNSLQEVFRVIISRETGLNCSKEIFTENPLAW